MPSSESLFLIGGVAPHLRATAHGTVSFSSPRRQHNFAPADVHILKLSTTQGADPEAPESDDHDASPKLQGVWIKVLLGGFEALVVRCVRS